MVTGWLSERPGSSKTRAGLGPIPRPTSEQIKKRAQISKWLKELNREEIHDLVGMIYGEGNRRGFGDYWMG